MALFMSEEEIAEQSWTNFVRNIHHAELIQYLKERRLYVNDEVCKSLGNLTEAIEKGVITESIVNRAEALEKQKMDIQIKLNNMHQFRPLEYKYFSPLIDEFKELKRNTEEFKAFVQRYVIKITAFSEHLEIELNTGLSMADELNEVVNISRKELYTTYGSRVRKLQEE